MTMGLDKYRVQTYLGTLYCYHTVITYFIIVNDNNNALS